MGTASCKQKTANCCSETIPDEHKGKATEDLEGYADPSDGRRDPSSNDEILPADLQAAEDLEGYADPSDGRGDPSSMLSYFNRHTDDLEQCFDDQQAIFSMVASLMAEIDDLELALPRGHIGRNDGFEAPSSKLSYFEQDTDDLEKIIVVADQNVQEQRPSFVFKSGAVYTGQWKGSMRHGTGAQRWPDGAVYEGNWQNNQADGKGRFIHRTGDIYIGSWKTNKAHGLGIYHDNNAHKTYEGVWTQDFLFGLGVETWNDGSRYVGLFDDGQKTGYGQYRWADGSHYEGAWKANSFEGNGTFSGADGRTFRGEWRGSVIHGIGKYQWTDGREYAGTYTSDKKEGFGIFTWSDGRKYEGFWHDGKQHGQGRFTSKDGTMHTALWLEGKPASPAKTEP